MMDQVNALQIVITVLGSGALFSFLQFLIQRKDNKAEKKIEERFREIEKKIEDGLDENEQVGLKRYEETITDAHKMMEIHKNDLQKILTTFEELKESDERVENLVSQLINNQRNICDAITGLAHDKLVYMTDRITERGAITLKEKATLDSIYIPYKAMGGNSHAKAGYEHVAELEVVSDDKAKEMDDIIKINRRNAAVKDHRGNTVKTNKGDTL